MTGASWCIQEGVYHHACWMREVQIIDVVYFWVTFAMPTSDYRDYIFLEITVNMVCL